MPVILPQASHIISCLSSAYGPMTVEVYPTLGSTNTYGRALVDGGTIKSPTLVVALAQTDGRGRMGRQFYSPPESGLYMTLICPPPPHVHVTPSAALATALAIQDFCGQRVDIKWVNDLWLEGKKVCGILAERMVSPDGQAYLLLGIGVNVTTKTFPEALRHPAGCILTPNMVAQHTYDLSYLAARILHHLFALWQDREGCLQGYRERFLLTGKSVAYAYVCTPDTPHDHDTHIIKGVVEGIDGDYNLLLRKDDQEVLVLGSGEVTFVENPPV